MFQEVPFESNVMPCELITEFEYCETLNADGIRQMIFAELEA